MVQKPDDEYPPSFWQDKAEEARALADNMISKDGKQSMLAIARIYEGLAASAERREAGRKKKPASH